MSYELPSYNDHDYSFSEPEIEPESYKIYSQIDNRYEYEPKLEYFSNDNISIEMNYYHDNSFEKPEFEHYRGNTSISMI